MLKNEKIIIKFKKLCEDSILPEKQKNGDAGYDCYINSFWKFDKKGKLYKFESPTMVLKPLSRCLARLGFATEIPKGYYCQLVPRSGLALRKGLGVVNSPATIDSNYRGEWGAILVNFSYLPIVVKKEERICQIIFRKEVCCEFKIIDKLAESERGEDGYGSTGTKSNKKNPKEKEDEEERNCDRCKHCGFRGYWNYMDDYQRITHCKLKGKDINGTSLTAKDCDDFDKKKDHYNRIDVETKEKEELLIRSGNIINLLGVLRSANIYNNTLEKTKFFDLVKRNYIIKDKIPEKLIDEINNAWIETIQFLKREKCDNNSTDDCIKIKGKFGM